MEAAGKTVVVGYDGQKQSERVLDRAIETVKVKGGKVIIVVAEELPPAGYDVGTALGVSNPIAYENVPPVVPDPDRPMPGVQEIIDRAMTRLRDAGVPGEYAWDIGDPADVILDAAREHHASTIMIGAHHRGFFGRLFENVEAEVRRDAQCEVVVVE